MIKNKKRRTNIIGRNRKGGFTLVETLVTVSIIIILLAIGMVAVIRYRDRLRITELDNMARSIYMAAQNRAVLLDNEKRFKTLVKQGTLQADGTFAGGGTEIKVTVPVTLEGGALGEKEESRRYIDSEAILSKAVLDDLLPTGTIDPALRKGRFYIVYEPDSASVTDVFYVEDKSYDLNIADALKELGADDKRDKRMKNEPVMVGWFGSNATMPPSELPKPMVEVQIENGEELTVKVIYTIDSQSAGVSMADMTRKSEVKLEYPKDAPEGARRTIWLLDASSAPGYMPDSSHGHVWNDSSRLDKDGKDIITDTVEEDQTYVATYTWVLDSLNSKHFKELFGGSVPVLGGDFTVTADLRLTAPNGTERYANTFSGDPDNTDPSPLDNTENSLFAQVEKGETAEGAYDGTATAYIKNLRHLQNLDTETSGVGGVTAAKQMKDIDAGTLRNNNTPPGNIVQADYKFIPIENDELRSYQADLHIAAVGSAAEPYFIRRLKVTADSSKERNGAGLFGKVTGKDAWPDQVFKFQDVRIVDSEIEGGVNETTGDSNAAGALAGRAEKVSFKDCQVVRTRVTGSSTGTDGIAGGMAGKTAGGIKETYTAGDGIAEEVVVTAENCVAEDVTVTARKSAGGLTGESTNGVFGGCRIVINNPDNKPELNTKVIGDPDADGSIAGGMAGRADTIRFIDCLVEGTDDKKVVVAANSIAGGMSGYSVGSTGSAAAFKECHVANAEVKSENYIAGGMAGSNYGSATFIFDRCSAEKINVESTAATGIAGGLLGYKTNLEGEANKGSVTFTKCTLGTEGTVIDDATGESYAIKVAGGQYAGGLLGGTSGNTDAVFNGCTVGKAAAPGAAKDVKIASNDAAGGMAGSVNKAAFDTYIDKDGAVKNCTVNSVSVTAKKYTGGMAGNMVNGGSFHNCKVANAADVEVKDSGDTATYNEKGEITGYSVLASIAGGLVGNAPEPGVTTFDGCTVGEGGKITVTANGLAGGMAGETFTDSKFINCRAVSAEVTGNGEGSYAGGLAADTGAAEFTNCTVGVASNGTAGEITVTAAKYAGGMAGCVWTQEKEAGINGCQVFNATVEGNGEGSYAGGLAGSVNKAAFAPYTVKEENKPRSYCTVNNVTVTAKGCAGGMTGNMVNGGSFSSCQVDNTTVTDTAKTPPIMGKDDKGKDIITGYEVGKSCAGGLVGDTGRTGVAKFTDCTVGESGKVTVTANGLAGGMAGEMAYVSEVDGGSFTNCAVFNTKVEGLNNGSYAGGLAADTGATKFDSCTVGKADGELTLVTAKKYAGGMAANSWGGSEFISCNVYNAKVTSDGEDSYAGGLAGVSAGREMSFNTCNVLGAFVKATNSAGGMMGHNWGSTVAFAACNVESITVDGGNSSGGLLGFKGEASVSFSNCVAGNAGSVEITISGGTFAGGLLGYTSAGCKATFKENCKVVNANVNAWTGHAGGLAGQTEKDSSLSYCTAGGETDNEKITVTAGNFGGGLVGRSIVSSFDNCKAANATVTTTGDHAGGLVGGSLDSSFHGCEAVNATVIGASSAGGLVGSLMCSVHRVEGDTVSITGCKVYWKNSLPNADDDYKVKTTAEWGSAGGLVGNSWAELATIQQSFAATLVYGRAYAGGLVGQVGSAKYYNDEGHEVAPNSSFLNRNTVNVKNSYATCYIKIKGYEAYHVAGGLIGPTQETVTLTLENVYVTGFITVENPISYAAGLCGGTTEGTLLTIRNAYAAMRYNMGGSIKPLAGIGRVDRCCYLNVPGVTGGQDYTWMMNSMLAYINGNGAFEKKNAGETHFYNIDNAGRSGDYPFPGLGGLDHYGDWVTSAQANGSRALKALSMSGNDLNSVSGNDMDSVSGNNADSVSGNLGDAQTGQTVSGNPGDPQTGGTTDGESGNSQTGQTVSGEPKDPGTGETPDEGKPPEGIVPPKTDSIISDDDEGGGGDTS